MSTLSKSCFVWHSVGPDSWRIYPINLLARMCRSPLNQALVSWCYNFLLTKLVGIISECCLDYLCYNLVVVWIGLLVPAKWLTGKIIFTFTWSVPSKTLNAVCFIVFVLCDFWLDSCCHLYEWFNCGIKKSSGECCCYSPDEVPPHVLIHLCHWMMNAQCQKATSCGPLWTGLYQYDG